MEKFRKNPIEVEAVQFTDKNKDQVYNWASSIQQNVFHDWDDRGQPILKIPTLEGEMICAIGDYLIKEPFPTDWRKLYPCKAEIFEKTYKPASAEPEDNFNDTLTKAEIDADTYFDWSDESIGRMTRYVMEKLKKTDMTGFKGIFTMASAHVLIQTALSVNAETFKTDIGGFSVKGEPKGDWEVIVRRKEEKKKGDKK